MLNKKGQMRILEAFLSIAVVFSAVMISRTFQSTPDLTNLRSLEDAGSQVLIQLDSDGMLGNLIVQRNWTSIRQSLELLLPMGVLFNLTVFDENSTQVNTETIQNSDILGYDTVALEYLCATETTNVEFFILRLQLAWVK